MVPPNITVVFMAPSGSYNCVFTNRNINFANYAQKAIGYNLVRIYTEKTIIPDIKLSFNNYYKNYDNCLMTGIIPIDNYNYTGLIKEYNHSGVICDLDSFEYHDSNIIGVTKDFPSPSNMLIDKISMYSKEPLAKILYNVFNYSKRNGNKKIILYVLGCRYYDHKYNEIIRKICEIEEFRNFCTRFLQFTGEKTFSKSYSISDFDYIDEDDFEKQNKSLTFIIKKIINIVNEKKTKLSPDEQKDIDIKVRKWSSINGINFLVDTYKKLTST
jgi:hypothetical protein